MKRIITFIWVIIFAFGSVSCGNISRTASNTSIEAKKFDDINEPISLVIIVGRHANAGKPTDDMIKIAKGLILKSYTDPLKDSKGNWVQQQTCQLLLVMVFPLL